MSGPAVTVDSLLAHREWVRTLARSLVTDEHAAEDIAQDAWVAALAGPPRNDTNVRGWLTRVVQNRARKHGRSRTRRSAREATVARADIAPDTASVVAEAEAQNRVVGAVLRLDEPYRTAVLLRFFESLPPREVAEQTGVPVETVRSRLRRARERLRQELGDGRGGLLAALAPLARPDSNALAATSAAGGTVVATKLVITAVVGLVAVGAGVLAFGTRGSGDAPAPRESASATLPEAPVTPIVIEFDDDEGAPDPAPEPTAPAEPSPADEVAESPAEAATPDVETARSNVGTTAPKRVSTRKKVDWNARLATPITCKFEDASMDDVVDFLARFSATNIVILPTAREGGDRSVTMEFEDAPLDTILDAMTMIHGLTWKIEDEVIQIE